jgi:hypothetical protein
MDVSVNVKTSATATETLAGEGILSLTVKT